MVDRREGGVEEPAGILAYLWFRLPILALFGGGFVVYRLLAVTGLAESLVRQSLSRVHGHPRRLLLMVVAAGAAMSCFVPNTITVLALLPVLKKVLADQPAADRGRLVTPLTLACIYGANIGGMGSLIGSPANLLLIGALDFYRVPGREQIGFLNWSLWALPLVAAFGLLAWLLVAFVGLPRDLAARNLATASDCPPGRLPRHQRAAGWGCLFFLITTSSQALLVGLAPSLRPAEPLLATAFFLSLLGLAFLWRPAGLPAPLLRPRDLLSGLPVRGLAFMAGLLGVFAGLKALDLDRLAAGGLAGLFGPDTSQPVIFLATTLTVIFLTEGLSNTVVSTAFFPIAFHAAVEHGFAPLAMMIAVALASTCAFMTPLATPCNALAYGEMRGTSLTRMAVLGLALNLAGAVLMTAWLEFIIPLVYH